jgi:phytoene dehydrogenase-like protein
MAGPTTAAHADAIVIGAGPNGLVAANVLADRGWRVIVLEANTEPGGAVRTGEITAPGFRNDLFSAFYPLAAASPVISGLDLDAHGLTWTHAPDVLAHPLTDRPAAVLSRDLEATIANMDLGARGDGASWRRIYERWTRVGPPFLGALLSPFPPVRSGLRLTRAAGPSGLRDLARLAVITLRRFTEEEFAGDHASLLFAGCALHADLTPESSGSALLGWLLMCVGQQRGFPVPVGGAQGLTDALVRRATALGAEVRCGRRVERITIHDGRATGVVTADGEHLTAGRAVLADCDAGTLYADMVGLDELPARFRSSLGRMQRSSGVFKIDWALDRPIPWTDPTVAPAGTVHVAEDLDELSVTATQLTIGQVPATPFILIGQMTTADATRSPAGTESVWAYTHVPSVVRGDAGGEGITGRWDDEDRRRFVDRMERRIERHAPGFTDRIIARHVMAPPDLEAENANLVGGDISGGTTQLHQQLVFRPVPGLGRAETPIRRLYLASASAHPGGAVHGACGANAARAAIVHHRLRR